MAFEGLSEKLQNLIGNLRGRTRITEADVKDITREIKLALLEADVNFKIVKDFTSTIGEKAVGQEVLKSITPGQQIVKIVHDELVKLLGSEDAELNISPNPPTIIMLAGLQGSGKTTMAGKLANLLRKKGKKPLLVACDVYRPAAIDQLKVVGKQLDIPVFSIDGEKNVVSIAKEALREANSKLNDIVIIDTAGRLQIDEVLMNELKELKAAVKPDEILLVVDSMTGQVAVDVSKTFNDELEITGVILTKLDGDTRGGAALSVKSVTGKSIKFIGTGEKMSDIEVFHPDRMATRILGMGDVISLVEKAQENIEMEEAIALEKKMRRQEFTLQDYLDQLEKVNKFGSFKSILEMIGVSNISAEQQEQMEKQLTKTKAIIHSMTDVEKKDPDILNASRRRRIAAGSGTTVQDVNVLIKQYDDMKKQMKMIMGNKGALMKAAKKFGGGKINPEDLKNMKF
ncbi:MAG: signal recognition particle protein [Clostridia bacterium]|nr:signal recognition particle protein [Clostridia bacterium]